MSMIQTMVCIVTQDTISHPSRVCFMSMYNEILVNTGCWAPNSKSDETRKFCNWIKTPTNLPTYSATLLISSLLPKQSSFNTSKHVMPCMKWYVTIISVTEYTFIQPHQVTWQHTQWHQSNIETLDGLMTAAISHFWWGGSGQDITYYDYAQFSILVSKIITLPVTSLTSFNSDVSHLGICNLWQSSILVTAKMQMLLEMPVLHLSHQHQIHPHLWVGSSRHKHKCSDHPMGPNKKPKKGQDFWSIVDQWFSGRIKEWGCNWGKYLELILYIHNIYR